MRDIPEMDRKEIGGVSRRGFLMRAMTASAGLALAPALLVDALAARPAEAADLFGKPSVADQKKVGAEAARQILQKYHEVRDSRAQAFVQMGARLVNALSPADQKKWDYNFHVIDSKEVNAFALPGGPMFMYTGLYDHLETMDALAAVTGHEMTHVRLEHWAKAYAEQQKRNLLLGLGLTIFHAGNAAQTIAGLANSAIGLKFSRGEESQADRGGFENMIAAGYNPNGMIQLFKELEKLSGNGATMGGDFLSDHPLTSDRIKAVQKWMDDRGDQKYPDMTPIIK